MEKHYWSAAQVRDLLVVGATVLLEDQDGSVERVEVVRVDNDGRDMQPVCVRSYLGKETWPQTKRLNPASVVLPRKNLGLAPVGTLTTVGAAARKVG